MKNLKKYLGLVLSVMFFGVLLNAQEYGSVDESFVYEGGNYISQIEQSQNGDLYIISSVSSGSKKDLIRYDNIGNEIVKFNSDNSSTSGFFMTDTLVHFIQYDNNLFSFISKDFNGNTIDSVVLNVGGSFFKDLVYNKKEDEFYFRAYNSSWSSIDVYVIDSNRSVYPLNINITGDARGLMFSDSTLYVVGDDKIYSVYDEQIIGQKDLAVDATENSFRFSLMDTSIVLYSQYSFEKFNLNLVKDEDFNIDMVDYHTVLFTNNNNILLSGNGIENQKLYDLNGNFISNSIIENSQFLQDNFIGITFCFYSSLEKKYYIYVGGDLSGLYRLNGQDFTSKICYSTVDVSTQKSKVVIEKEEGKNIDYYIIHKEVSLNQFDSIGTLDFESLDNFFIDQNSNPSSYVHRYRVTAVNEEGEKTPLSDVSGTIQVLNVASTTGEIILGWNNPEGVEDVSTYTVYEVLSNGDLDYIDAVPGSVNQYVVNNPSSQTAKYIISIDDAVICGQSGSGKRSVDDDRIMSNVLSSSVVNSVDNTLMNVELNVYPNPSNGLINIETSDYNNLNMVVLNSVGQVVYNELINSQRTTLDLRNLGSNGMYLIVLNDEFGNRLSTERVLLK
jgi:hypothetical protein